MSDSASVKVYIPDDDLVWVAADLLPNYDPNSDEADVIITDNDYLSANNYPLPSSGSAITKKYFPERKLQLSKVLKAVGMTSLPLQNADFPVNGVEDMCTLGYLHEGSILDNLKLRFRSQLPYTYTGNICLAINPYTWLDNYTQELREKYANQYRYQLPPHVYAISAQAYRGVSERNRNQSILVSGESGAGKTETVKILIGHIANIASKQDDTTITKVLEANPLLESFGNAKTVRNDNSSRFGKYIELQFDQNAVLAGSECITYLLEKTRVVVQTNQERNYHIFYQLLAAPESETRELRLHGKKAEYFSYTREGDQTTDMIEGLSDADHFLQTKSELSLLGIHGGLQAALLRALTGILFLGQIHFEGVVGNEYSSPDDAMVSMNDDVVKESLSCCCEMIGVSIEDFTRVITSRSIEVQGQQLRVPLKLHQASSSRDALAKEIYSRVFQWLVHVINFNTSIDRSSESYFNKSHRVIGLLDIFGFGKLSCRPIHSIVLIGHACRILRGQSL
jgi:myosin V